MPRIQVLTEDGEALDLNTVTPWAGEGGMNLIPGEYAFEVLSVEEKTTRKNTQQLELKLKTLQGLETSEFDGDEVTHWLSLSSKSAGRLVNMANAIARPFEADGSFDTDAWVGGQFLAEVYEEPYKKTDPITGIETVRMNKRIRGERPIEDASGAAAAPAGAPAAAPPAAPPTAAPTQVAPRTAAAAPRVAAGNPGRQAPAAAFPRPVSRLPAKR
jgi:hypothetical protein